LIIFKIKNIFKSELTQTRRENGILTEKVIQFENAKTILENELLGKNQENEKIKNEKAEIDHELNIFGQRNVQLENEIVQHLEGNSFILSNVNNVTS